MANQSLATYLNNHLSASVTALSLLSTLAEIHADTEIGHFAADLHAEIEHEQQEVEKIMEGLQITKNLPGKVTGWLAEKFAQIKLVMDGASEGKLHLLESLELLLIGIEGKRALWRALAATAVPGLPIAEYERYAERSEEQQRRVEAVRIETAKSAFTD